MDNEEAPSLDELKRKLERVSVLDLNLEVFGADQHKYKSHPLSNAELERLEGELGVNLPADYRQFLLEIGYGAGPYCGLFSPTEILSELNTKHFDWQARLPDPSRPFPFNREDAEENFRIMAAFRNATFRAEWPTDGCIQLCEEGDGYGTFLVTAGELIGSLWSHGTDDWEDDAPSLESWNLPDSPPATLHKYAFGVRQPVLSTNLTFLQWYKVWLDLCLLHLQQS